MGEISVIINASQIVTMIYTNWLEGHYKCTSTMYVKCQLNSLKKEIEHVHINNEK